MRNVKASSVQPRTSDTALRKYRCVYHHRPFGPSVFSERNGLKCSKHRHEGGNPYSRFIFAFNTRKPQHEDAKRPSRKRLRILGDPNECLSNDMRLTTLMQDVLKDKRS